jgi:DNA (cytosine-5)-methyltransferase 1
MPTVIDLFAGAGGLSLGAIRAGFKLLAAVENDPLALGTHKENFPGVAHLNADISSLKGEDLLDATKLKREELDGLIGGPPCQGFSPMGKNNVKDKRNDLFVNFFQLVKEVKPKFFLAENVPGILGKKHDKTRRKAFGLVQEEYDIPTPIIVKANEYCAPTTRTRVFFIGYRRPCIETLSEASFSPPIEARPIYVKDALKGLPADISPEWQAEEESWRAIEPIEEDSFYGARIVGHIPDGVGDRKAIERYIKSKEVSGCFGTRHCPGIVARFNRLRAGEVDLISRLPRLDLNGFCPTIRAGTGRDKGCHQSPRPVHPTLPRVITPREGARLQGFPDWFVFHPTKWHSFRQIGNSVSPLVAETLLHTICKNFS